MTGHDDAANQSDKRGVSARLIEASNEDNTAHDHFVNREHPYVMMSHSAAVPLLQQVVTLARHTGGSVMAVTQDMTISACAGTLFDRIVRAGRGSSLDTFARAIEDVDLMADVRKVMADQAVNSKEFISLQGHWLKRTLSVLHTPTPHALVTYQDVTQKYIQKFTTGCQDFLMQVIANHRNADMVFRVLVQLLESCSRPGTQASVLCLADDPGRLRHIAGSGLADGFRDALERVSPESGMGPWHQAMRDAKRAVSTDLTADAVLPESLRRSAAAGDLRACWVEPVLNAESGRVIGVVAVYRDRPGAPNSTDIALVEAAARLASVALCDLWNEGTLRLQATLLDNVREAVIATDAQGVIRYWGHGAEALLEASSDSVRGRSLDTVLDIGNVLDEARQEGRWSGNLSLGDTPQAKVVEACVTTVEDHLGQGGGFIAILWDVTERREAELRAIERSRQHRMVAYLGRIALGDIGLQALLDYAVEALAEVLNVPLCNIHELSKDRRSLRMRAGVGWRDGLVGKMRLDVASTGLAAHTLRTSKPVIVRHLREDARFRESDLLNEHGVVSAVNVVIQGPVNQHYGVLGVYTTRYRDFSDHDINFLQSVANVLSETIRHRMVNASLRYSEQRFRDLANAMPQIVWSAHADGTPDYVNDRWTQLFGAEQSRLDSAVWVELLHPADRNKWLATWESALQTAAAVELECRLVSGSGGDYRWHLVRAVPVRSSADADIRWYGSCTDIHDQKRIELRLREQTHQLEMVNWINATLAAELDLEKLVQTVVDVGTQLSGARAGVYFCRETVPTGHVYTVYATCGMAGLCMEPAHIDRLGELYEQAADTVGEGRAVAYRDMDSPVLLVSADEKIALRSILAAPVVSRQGQIIGGLLFAHPDPGIFDDDDERLIEGLASQAAIAVDNASLYADLSNSRNEMHRQYEQLNAIYATAPIGLCFIDAALRVVSINDHLCDLLGARSVELVNRSVVDVFGHVSASLEEICREALSAAQPVLNREVRWTKGEEEQQYWSCNLYPITETDGRVLGINTVVQDITERKRAEHALARLGSIVDNSYDAIVGKTLEGRITSWNLGAERIYGHSAEEAVGQSIAILVPPERMEEEEQILSNLRAGRHVTLDDTVRLRKDGSRIRVSLTISPIRNRAGDIVGVSTIARDITASKLAEQAARENEARMRLILQTTRIGTWDWLIGTDEVRCSENMDELYGRPPGSFDGTLDQFQADVYPEDRERLRAAVKRALQDNEYQVEYRVLTDDGRIRWIESRGQLVQDSQEGRERMVGISMDITERKEAEQALRVSETMLREQTKELETAHRQKDEFLAMLAHELRNPLAPIGNATQLLKVQSPEQRQASLPWAIDVIDRQLEQLSRLVDDLLDIARITRGQIELKTQKEDLREIIRQAVDTATVWFKQKQQTFSLSQTQQPVIVDADATRLIQVIANLLSNASKFTAEHGSIELQLTLSEQHATIRVRDNGIGISSDLLPHVFDLFAQADRSLDRRQGGLGLGLSLVRKLVEMHGGDVSADSPGIGHGSIFTMRLPLAGTQALDNESESQAKEQSLTQMNCSRVLVVDDNEQATDAMVMLLETLGQTVEKAYSGVAALEVAERFRPDIVFLDIGLPLMDGYEVAARLRARYGADIRLVALSGYAPQQARQHGGAMEFDQYILKPISLDKLLSVLG